MIAFPRPKLLDSSKRDQKLTRRKIESSLRHAKCVKSSAMSVHEDYSHLNLTATIKFSACWIGAASGSIQIVNDASIC